MSVQLAARAIRGAVAVLLVCAGVVQSQVAPVSLDSLIRLGLERNPSIRIAEQGQRAARARIGPAGAWADPVLGLGVTDLPIARPGFYDDFTTKVARVTQTLPLAGAPSARGRAAEREAKAAGYRVDATRLDLIERIKDAYYENAALNEIVYVDARGRDIGGYVRDAQRLLDRRLTLPAGYRPILARYAQLLKRVGREAMALDMAARVERIRTRFALRPYTEPACLD